MVIHLGVYRKIIFVKGMIQDFSTNSTINRMNGSTIALFMLIFVWDRLNTNGLKTIKQPPYEIQIGCNPDRNALHNHCKGAGRL